LYTAFISKDANGVRHKNDFVKVKITDYCILWHEHASLKCTHILALQHTHLKHIKIQLACQRWSFTYKKKQPH